MRTARIVLLAAAAATALAVAAPASARGPYRGGPRVSFSVGFGVPAYYPYWYGPRYYYPYYYPPAVVVSSPPVTYVEQQPAPVAAAPAPSAAPAPAAGYWYYCADSSAYYPYVQSCASGWQRVSPTPPGQ